MAYILIEGFDYYGTPNEILLEPSTTLANGSSPSINDVSLVQGFFSHGRALALKNTNASPNVTYIRSITSVSELYCAFDVLFEVLPTSTTTIVWFDEGATNHVNVQLNTNGTIQGRRSTTNLGSASTFQFSTNIRYRVEIRALIADTGGVLQVRVDGNTILNLTNQDTRNAATGVVNSISLRSCIRSDNFGNTIYDNFTINDTTGAEPTGWPGARRVETLFPNADASVQWQRSTGGLNYDLVNSVGLDAGRYVFSNTTGDVDRYGFTNLSANPTNIDAVQLVYHAMRTDPGSRTIRGFIRSGSSTVNGATETPTVSPAGRYYRVTAHQDPATSSAWTASGVNAIEGGIEVVS